MSTAVKETPREGVSVTIIGAGIAGICAAYFIKKTSPKIPVCIVDCVEPMSFTSAQSGENYRNWWPHPTMSAFIDHSIDLMQDIAAASNNRILMTRGGYLLASRSTSIDEILHTLAADHPMRSQIRYHSAQHNSYRRGSSDDWQSVIRGIDILSGNKMIKRQFPQLDPQVQHLLHIRRAGDISAQQLGQWMLEQARSLGLQQVRGEVVDIHAGADFTVEIADQAGSRSVHSEIIINAAGPFINRIAQMWGESLPIQNYLQQKIAFEDTLAALPRDQPFTVDLDRQFINWTEPERQWLETDEDGQRFLQEMPGGIHCRPVGGANSRWVKLGWAYNQTAAPAQRDPSLDAFFPDIVIRGASRLNPGLQSYTDRPPGKLQHYGGWYTITEENFPLIGPCQQNGAYVIGALSGFGSMAACAAGKLIADYLSAAPLPSYAADLAPQRYANTALMSELTGIASRGIL